MASANWKVFPDASEEHVEYVQFLKTRKFFAVDDSGSTGGAILRSEREFVDRARQHFGTPDDTISLWGSRCDVPSTDFEKLGWDSRHCGTSPEEILKTPAALRAVQQSEVWFLVTDGQVGRYEVQELAQLAQKHAIMNVPVIFLIVGYPGPTPEATDISVGISLFSAAQDTLILFKTLTTGVIHVIAEKGCFASTGVSSGEPDLTSWDNLPKYANETELFQHFGKVGIEFPRADSRRSLPTGLNLGPDWERAQGGPVRVDLDLLLHAGRLSDEDALELLSEDAFDKLAVASKTRGQTQELRRFVQAQKTEQSTPKLEDVSGAATIITKLGSSEITDGERKDLQEQLRRAHSKNREHYLGAIDRLTTSVEAQRLRKRNQLVDAAMRTLAGIEAASFNAEILSRRSNRARRAEAVSASGIVSFATLDLQGPAYKGYCLICCGEDETMSICLKELDADHVDDNTADFALNFPLAAGSSAKNVNMLSSQNVCFQCAVVSPNRSSIFNEQLKAIIPAVRYEGHNKQYIHEQLYLALTDGLSTGAAGVSQLFMAILEQVLRTKPWAGAGLDESTVCAEEQREALQRKKTFEWMLNELLQHTRTRETFNELGDWVKFPQALAWIAKDFETKGLASFVVTYPVAGFSKILSLGQRCSVFTQDSMRLMRIAKSVYSVAAKYLADMQSAIKNGDHSQNWKHGYLELIYREFNAQMVPRDLGLDSVLRDEEAFNARLAKYLDQSQQESGTSLTMRKIQVILFWLIYHQKGHCTAQTFFTNITQKEHLASAILDPSLPVPETESSTLLLSIFAKEAADFIDPAAAALHDTTIPFGNPFGASVLRCGVESCGTSFYESDIQDLTPSTIDNVRGARSKHLINVFGLRGRFETSTTGLPEPTRAGDPPASIHTNLHIGVARTWAAQSREQRRKILDDATERDVFVAQVRKNVCEQGRGDIFGARCDDQLRDILPSFFDMIALALRLEGRGKEDVTVYEHDFGLNRMEWKIRWERSAGAGPGVEALSSESGADWVVL